MATLQRIEQEAAGGLCLDFAAPNEITADQPLPLSLS